MYYNLLNKNVITAALVSLIIIGATGTCEAQGVVSLVEEENIVLPQDNTAEVVNEDFNDFGIEINAEIPDALSDNEEEIPFNNEGIISPAPATDVVEDSKENNETESSSVEERPNEIVPENEIGEEILPNDSAVEETADVIIDEQSQEVLNQFEDDFDLGLENALPEEIEAPVEEAKPIEPVKLPEVKKVEQRQPKPRQNPLVVATLTETPQAQPSKEVFANSVLSKIDNDLFSQMSDIEKQTTLLTLELRREKIRSEIEAIKAQRTRAEEEKIAAQEAKKKKEIEWQKEQEAKIIREQQILKEKEIELEKIRQRKVLNAYMNKMLEDKQNWIKENAELLKKLKEVEDNRNEIADNFKKKLENLNTLSNKMIQSANSAKSNHDRTIASLTAQNIQLKKRIEADAAVAQNMQQNPFGPNAKGDKTKGADIFEIEEEPQIDITKEYAIMDIIGKGEDLVAKLINKEGDTFVARKGTVLQSGYTVDEITYSYVKFKGQGTKQYLYTGGFVEPEKIESSKPLILGKSKNKAEKESASSNVGDKSAPSLGAGMFVK